MKEIFAGIIALGALTFSVGEASPAPVPPPVDFGTRSAPAGVMPESLKINLGGFIQEGPTDGKGRRKHKDPPARKLIKAS